MTDLTQGQALARGVARRLAAMDFAALPEFVPCSGLRVDLMALGPAGELWIVECKSGRADFTADRKWQGYLAWCDRFFWAVDDSFPQDLLPEETGLFIADRHDGALIRMAPEHRLAGARRGALTRRFARHAARRLAGLTDPALSGAGDPLQGPLPGPSTGLSTGPSIGPARP